MADRVFREGVAGLELVGDFDGLYSEEADPWQQSGVASPMGAYYAKARQRLAETLQGRAGKAIEVGCGHGHALAFLAAHTALTWQGMDISRVAVDRARQNYPELTFKAGDIRKPCAGGRFDVVLLNQLLWYVLPQFDAVVRNSVAMLPPGGLLVIAQAYLKGQQRFAVEIADGFGGMMDLMSRRYPALHLFDARYDDDASLPHNDGILVYRC